MNHQHFKEISSTQDFLLENINPNESENLISCENQTHGHGQYERKWDAFSGSLCLSFTLTPNKVITLSSLEIGCLLIKYYKEFYQKDLKLKWPNDVLTLEAEKVAGILLNNQNNNQIIVGVGINYFREEKAQKYKTPFGYVFNDIFDLDKKLESARLYNFIKNNRVGPDEVINCWNQNCIHLNKNITYQESGNSYQGLFKGIGKNGEALIQTPQGLQTVYTGSIIL